MARWGHRDRPAEMQGFPRSSISSKIEVEFSTLDSAAVEFPRTQGA
jgi:hypothetical protein